ncbi:MAG TPA: AMP-binding protein, partial [Longimicrobiaceae bacterium]|nr:AMP-binding protein [Longimicrobiaceae bacterium]
ARPLGPAREFWSRTLAGFEAPVLLPPGSAPAGEADEYRRAAAGLPAAASAALRSAARRHGLTLGDLVHGAWAVLLGRHAGEDDVVFGSVVSGRAVELPGAAEMVGVLVNTLPVRARIAAEAPRAGWLAGLQRDLREAREHEHTPLAEIQRVSGTGAGTPLFGSILDVTNHPDDRGGGWVARRWSMQKTGYPVFVVAHPGAELRLEVTCRAALHDEAQLRRLPGRLAAVLEGMGGLLGRADAEDARVGSLPWLTAGERAQVLEEWNRTDTPLPGESLAELFAAQAARTPGAPALVCGDERLSYAELDLRTRRLARALRREGVGPESLVGLLAPRGLPFWVAVLGVLRAGAAYLPLDPAHPPRRHRQVLEQSRASLVLSAGALLPGLAAALEGADAPGARLLPLEELLARPEPPEDGGDAGARPWGRSLAYVIFTSGSTGAPKGAMVEQRGMLNHLHAKIAALALGPADRVAQTASQCFDISVWQFLAGLLVGAEVQVIPDAVAHDPAALAREVEARGITILETVPSLMRLLVEELGAGGGEAPGLGGLRWMIPTGEALPPELARQWLSAYPRVPLLNAYGPTECSDDVTHHVLERGPGAAVRHTPIGRGIGNVRLYVLDGVG